MGHPWNSPRHRSWASNTVISGAALFAILLATVIIDSLGEPPTYLVGLLGTAAGAFFGAIGHDKSQREREIATTANRAERKVDRLGAIAEHEHPGSAAAYDTDQEGGD